MPAKTAVVGQVSTHWPTRRSTCLASSLPDIEKISIARPGRPSGVSSRAELALDAGLAAAGDHRGREAGRGRPPHDAPRRASCAVMTRRVAFIGKASAKVSSMLHAVDGTRGHSLAGLCTCVMTASARVACTPHAAGSSRPPLQQRAQLVAADRGMVEVDASRCAAEVLAQRASRCRGRTRARRSACRRPASPRCGRRARPARRP